MRIANLARILKHVDLESDAPCWRWTAYLDKAGYGRLTIPWPEYKHHIKSALAHRFSYATFNGLEYREVPKNMQIDHLCRNHACVNPAHLELVTPGVNVRRGWAARPPKTHCKFGHPLTMNSRQLACKPCYREASRRSIAKSKGFPHTTTEELPRKLTTVLSRFT